MDVRPESTNVFNIDVETTNKLKVFQKKDSCLFFCKTKETHDRDIILSASVTFPMVKQKILIRSNLPNKHKE